jgi:histone RNA hairpin-binding protein
MTECKLSDQQVKQREKQIDKGKNTPEYQLYIKIVPKSRRRFKKDPETPKAKQRRSVRSFRGLVSKWRRELHEWADGSVSDLALSDN